MEVDINNDQASSGDWNGRWDSLKPILQRSGPFGRPDFVPGAEQNLECVRNCKILIIGAGGLGCELLKDLAMMGFQDLHVIDMDTIDTSNLNRQFLFRTKDVGRPKAEVSAEFINRRVPNCRVTPHYCQIQDKPPEFYQGYNIIVSGLDSIVARRWINAMLVSLLRYDADGNLDPSSIIPLIDGGTEGFKGNARVILPGFTPCVECTLSLYPPQVNYPMCTIAHTPRLPEHCIEYARVLVWPQEKPFGEVAVDGDDPKHIQWIYEIALQRAEKFGIAGVTYRLTQGVVKHIIPAVASTNAAIAALCALEVFKMATNCAMPLNNYLTFQDADGIYTSVVALEKNDDCLVCSQKPQNFTFADSAKLQEVVDFLVEDPNYQMKSPSITAGGQHAQTLYVRNIPSLERQTKPNLKKTLKELGLQDGQHLYIADATTPQTLTFLLHLTCSSSQENVAMPD